MTVEGRLQRPETAWRTEHFQSPTEARVSLAQATLYSADLGLGGEGSPTEPPVGLFDEPLTDHTQRVNRFLGGPVLTRITLSKIHSGFGGGQVSGATLAVPQWPLLRTPIHFILKAALAYPLSYHRCYIDVPELFSSVNRGTSTAYAKAEMGGEGGGEADVAAAEVLVRVDGYIVLGSSIGAGGTASEGGVRYECQSYARPTVPPNLEPKLFEIEAGPGPYRGNANPNCSGTPIFEAPGQGSDVTRRLFAAGILGALAATLIVEALFLGETEGSGRHWLPVKHRRRVSGE